MLPRTASNDPEQVERIADSFAEMFRKDVCGKGGAKFMADFHQRMTEVLSAVSKDLTELLAGNEQDLITVAGDLKYALGDLKILKACAEVAATMEGGRCYEVGLSCMGCVLALERSLTSTRDALRQKAA